MDCVNHTGVNATAYCQSCGKALCAGCVRNAAGGQILCEPCWTAWNSYQQPFASPYAGTPSPATAAVLGLIPGVGAMYNGQFVKGLVHVVIFAILVSAAHLYGVFGIFIAGWIVYQSFEAYHTARARRDGQPLPDPLGLNDVGNWINPGARQPYSGPPNSGPPYSGPPPRLKYRPTCRPPINRFRTRVRIRPPHRASRTHPCPRSRLCPRFRRRDGAAESLSAQLFSSRSGCCFCWGRWISSPVACLSSPGLCC